MVHIDFPNKEELNPNLGEFDRCLLGGETISSSVTCCYQFYTLDLVVKSF